MPPPKLAADAPVLDVVHPVEVGLGPVFRNEFYLAAFHRLDRGLGERFDTDVPLICQVGLDDRSRAIAAWNLDRVILDFVEQAE